MEIIVKPEEQDTIMLSEVNPEIHIVVGIDCENRPVLFTPIVFDNFNYMKALIVSNSIGNSYCNDGKQNLKALILKQQTFGKTFKKLAAFPKEDWKEAFKWLIDNA